jgi:micrococcal nuclease
MIVSLVVAVFILAGVGYLVMNAPPTVSTERPPPSSSLGCKTSDPSSGALCFEATVTRVIDGDTLETDDGTYVDRIRLVLVDAPELSEAGGAESKDYLASLCLGKKALIDEEDWQVDADPYGRILAVVSCGGTNANAAMISSGHATTYYRFCPESEFGNEAWTGCTSPPSPEDCDPSYPDVCIPPPPPDLNCADIPYRNFRVLPPDPHRFDGDGDGIGCES